MNSASWITFRFFLEKCAPDKKKRLAHYLGAPELETLSKTPSLSRNPFESVLPIEQRLNEIHYSWLIPFLEPFAEMDKLTILSALSPLLAKKLHTHFTVDEDLKEVSHHAKHFIQETIYKWLITDEKEYLPVEFLPDHPLLPLLSLSKSELQILVDFLGLHDIATEISQVIQSEQIIKIERSLSKNQLSYLKGLLKKKEPVSFARLNLDQWDGNEDKLKKILHHRGFNRLGKALFGCHPAFLWHISHKFDVGRSKILHKFFTDINNNKAQETLINQILELISFIKKGSK